jgi:hypothetical protein
MGGSSKSSTSQSSQATDNRQVITNTTSSYDLSNRSTNAYDLSDRSQTNSNNTSNLYDASKNNSDNSYDLSDRSTSNLYDSSSKVTNTTTSYTTLDGGAVAGGLAAARDALDKMFGLSVDTTDGAYTYADGLFSTALEFANKNDNRMVDAFEHASAVQDSAIGQLQDAYADAQGTSKAQEKIVLAVLAVAGVGLLVAMKKG